LDGEVVSLDASGRAQFYPLLHRRADPYFYAFDCLWLDGRDLRRLALVDRKRILRVLVPPQPSRLLYVDHLEARGVDLFREVCQMDLEGIVAKRRDGTYDPDAPTWVKIKNRSYSQAVGRHEHFQRLNAPGNLARQALRE
jgi:bifunctional non-homologous end joining protein LigD